MTKPLFGPIAFFEEPYSEEELAQHAAARELAALAMPVPNDADRPRPVNGEIVVPDALPEPESPAS